MLTTDDHFGAIFELYRNPIKKKDKIEIKEEDPLDLKSKVDKKFKDTITEGYIEALLKENNGIDKNAVKKFRMKHNLLDEKYKKRNVQDILSSLSHTKYNAVDEFVFRESPKDMLNSHKFHNKWGKMNDDESREEESAFNEFKKIVTKPVVHKKINPFSKKSKIYNEKDTKFHFETTGHLSDCLEALKARSNLIFIYP